MGGTTIFGFYGGDTAVMRGDIELMGGIPQSPPLGKTLHFADYFTQTSHIHLHNTRSAARGDFFMVRKNTLQYGWRSISFHGAKIWNNIPSEIRDSQSVRTLKTN